MFFGKTDTKTQKKIFVKTDTKRKTQKHFLGIRIRKRIRYIRVFQNPGVALQKFFGDLKNDHCDLIILIKKGQTILYTKIDI